MIVRKTAAELQKMRRSGLLVWQILEKLTEMVAEGVSTMDLEVAAAKMMADAGAIPAFKNYYVPAAGQHYKFVLWGETGRLLRRFRHYGTGGRGRRADEEAS